MDWHMVKNFKVKALQLVAYNAAKCNNLTLRCITWVKMTREVKLYFTGRIFFGLVSDMPWLCQQLRTCWSRKKLSWSLKIFKKTVSFKILQKCMTWVILTHLGFWPNSNSKYQFLADFDLGRIIKQGMPGM